MSLLQTVGPRVYLNAFAAANPSWVPPPDRAWICRRIAMGNLSADDDWQVLVGQREIFRFRMLATGNQRTLLMPTIATAFNPNFFDWCRSAIGLDPSFAIPLGMPVQVQSIGGATADVELEVREVTPDEAQNWPVNNFLGNVYLLPIFWRLNAGQVAPGAIQLDTQTAPPYVPALHNNAGIPVNWKVEILALFFEGMGVNTFSGAANHQSTTQNLQWFKNQVQILTRTALAPAQVGLHGPPVFGAASAAGSANTVFGQRSGFFPPFQLSNDKPDSVLDTPLVFQGGETSQLFVELVGDLTGTATYAKALQMAIARVTAPVPIGGQL